MVNLLKIYNLMKNIIINFENINNRNQTFNIFAVLSAK